VASPPASAVDPSPATTKVPYLEAPFYNEACRNSAEVRCASELVVTSGSCITPSEADSKGVPGEHIKLIALLNRFGLNPMSK
jgi:hypothetical protein